MADVMLLAEIERRLESEWVLLEDPKPAPSLEIIGGRILWHSKDRDEVYRKARELRLKHTGTIPEETVVVL